MVYLKSMMKLRAALVALGIAAVPLLALAQTLPQSTVDRQQIQNLQYQANLPGTSPTDRANIQRQITQLQYQINTRPPIQPLPTMSPAWNAAALVNGQLPRMDENPKIAPTAATIYGSCDADRSVIAYLTQEIQMSETLRQERLYDENQRALTEKDLHSKGC
jgi:hypothetical protein